MRVTIFILVQTRFRVKGVSYCEPVKQVKALPTFLLSPIDRLVRSLWNRVFSLQWNPFALWAIQPRYASGHQCSNSLCSRIAYKVRWRQHANERETPLADTVGLGDLIGCLHLIYYSDCKVHSLASNTIVDTSIEILSAVDIIDLILHACPSAIKHELDVTRNTRDIFKWFKSTDTTFWRDENFTFFTHTVIPTYKKLNKEIINEF